MFSACSPRRWSPGTTSSGSAARIKPFTAAESSSPHSCGGTAGAVPDGGNRWVANVSEFLGPDLDAVLEKCEKDLADGAIGESYKLFIRSAGRGVEQEKYQGIGSSFFTKILYFLARNRGQDSPAEYPLILDTKVSMALAQMTGYRLLVRPDSYRPRPDSKSYARFVKAMHKWAAKLNVSPEVIEYYFWDEVSKDPSALWKACVAQYGFDFS
jgi:hypothetical protein